MAVGDLIPFATMGTVMPNGMEIAQREMRGQMSNGMCCAADEIGLVSGDERNVHAPAPRHGAIPCGAGDPLAVAELDGKVGVRAQACPKRLHNGTVSR